MNVRASSVPPTGSKWAIGLSVSRPNILAVPSPSRYAASAWLNSWTGSPMSSMMATTIAAGTTVGRRCASGTLATGRVPRIVAGPRPRAVAAGSEARQQVRLLALVLLGADRAAVAQVGQAGERAGDLVRVDCAGRRGAGAGAARPAAGGRRPAPSSAAAGRAGAARSVADRRASAPSRRAPCRPRTRASRRASSSCRRPGCGSSASSRCRSPTRSGPSGRRSRTSARRSTGSGPRR